MTKVVTVGKRFLSFLFSIKLIIFFTIKAFLASGSFCRLLIHFANCLDPDQDQHNVGPDLDLK